MFVLSAAGFLWACETAQLITAANQPHQTPTRVADASRRLSPTRHPSLTPEHTPESSDQTKAPTEIPPDQVTPPEAAGAVVSKFPTEAPVNPPTDNPPTNIPPTREPPPPRPTRTPTPTETAAPVVSPTPSRCPQIYCVIKSDCQPGENTRAIGTVYDNGVPVNGVKVRVSTGYQGSPAAADFLSGHDPINTSALYPDHAGYYQIGIVEGSPHAGTWWVFLLDDKGNVISEGHSFITQDVESPNSCQIGITDFGK